ncbi:MAG: hypothetical protein ABSG68_05305 [Thermoguttaceae bacterium]
MNQRKLISALAALLASAPLASLGAKGPEKPERAIERLVPREASAARLSVDLVAAVHIAQKSYYQQLNHEFKAYDAVLYELVAPPGTRIPKGGKSSDNPISLLQNGMKSLLELQFQLDEVDYTLPNMVHADMSPEQVARSMQQRGETVLGMFGRLMGYAMTQSGQGSDVATASEVLSALLDGDRALALKRVMAEQFQEMDGMLTAISGPDGSTIITERNKAALDVLRKQIASGKHKIAIFYGAGHMPDLEKRLLRDFALVPLGTRWLVAWDLKGPAQPPRKTLAKPGTLLQPPHGT